MGDVLAFADEYGQPNLDTRVENVSTHYIIAAVIVENDEARSLRTKLDAVRKKHFQTGAMRSKGIAGDDARRLRVLEEVKATGLHALALVVDKDLVHKDSALRFQKPFRRWLNRKLYDELYRTYPSLLLTADQVGRKEFMAQFKAFLDKSHVLNTLFNDSAMTWGNAKEDVLLQAADIVCGSLGRCFDRKKMSPRASEIRAAIKPWVQIRDWPWTQPERVEGSTVEDKAVARVAIQRARTFIDKFHATKDEDVRNQVSCLKYLLFYMLHVDPAAYAHAAEIINSIQVPREMMLREFQTRVVAKLRDADVLIASDARGYKIPSTMNDVLEYLRWTNRQVEPMVARAKRMAEAIQLGSNNTIRLLDEEEFHYLRGPSC